MRNEQKLSQEYNILLKRGIIEKKIPSYVVRNLNPHFYLRPYQIEAIARFIYYIEKDFNKKKPIQLLFNMATGSGKTLLMAANILYLYNIGYRNFLFFVNSTNIIEKTRDNFLNRLSPKYLFNEKVKFDNKEVYIREVSNFDNSNEEDINIIFTTIQGLHSQLNLFRENSVTFEDFKDKKIVLISDEAHHINAWTKNKLNETEQEIKKTWEYTVMQILYSNIDNVLLEYTATIDMDHPAIYEKYRDKIIFEYDLKQFRIDGYSKEVKVLQADLENWGRMLQAVILSQYRRKIAEKYGIRLKPVILFKSKSIKESKENYELFRERIDRLNEADIETIKSNATGTVLEKAFKYFENEKITFGNLIAELKEDFSEEKCILLDSENIDKEKQIMLNTLENENNEVRAIFAVKMLDEGWDVLNLFDIVRLYDTRDGYWTKDGKYIPGNTTIAERQLIGRGARYYPFKVNEDDDPFRRKFDDQPDKDLKILEELYYHSKHNPRYIQELTATLKECGLMPYEEKDIHLKVKPQIKNTSFWEKGFLFVNERVKIDYKGIKTIDDLKIEKIYKYTLPSGFLTESNILDISSEGNNDKSSFEHSVKMFKLEDFGESIIRKAMSKLDFYKFSNLKQYFPNLTSSKEFINSLKKISVEILSSKEKLNSLTPDDKLKACLNVLMQLENEIKSKYVEYKGTEVFIPLKVKNVIRNKQLRINVGDYGDQEFGIPMSTAKHIELRLNLANKEWFIYEEDYGTFEEKSFIKFLDSIIEELKQHYSEIYLLRNASLFKLYNFTDGEAIEPDFVLFLKKEHSNDIEQYQLFIEPKGEHLVKKDQWKEDFLKKIEEKYQISLGSPLVKENEKYKLIGLPFYNDSKKHEFIEIFRRKLTLF
ncbi:DEAD/DEAH box helicase family protein [Thermodesulfovibrio yellowstonii]|uniref:DEAD/DEAH box helicase family protein n=1 Tax=Thermodesulfovibrio yellowstonii TaxID=28262 RepID=UPI0003F920A1|nr:DEAD/DEAH box helicase family protein [Thermodesulfovibrio islandicus]